MEKLLIVEDEQDLREALQSILELAGYEVLTAKNGKDGYDAIMTHLPDLVLCDVNMPELDGFELLSAINQRLSEEIVPPFIFLTAKVTKNDVRRGMNLGADDYIVKPFEYTEVLTAIRLRLDKRKKLLKNGKNNRILSTPDKTFDKLAIPCGDGIELIAFDKIIRCEADRAYCTFHLIDKRKILVSKSMKEFEETLIHKDFMKVHKSTIVNINFVKKFVRGKSGHLVMSDGSVVAVSIRKKAELLDRISS
ncbi:MAG: response regulator [Crocinitomix sp.]|nr:response regulator [Crocinitomix sp.]